MTLCIRQDNNKCTYVSYLKTTQKAGAVKNKPIIRTAIKIEGLKSPGMLEALEALTDEEPPPTRAPEAEEEGADGASEVEGMGV